MYIEFFNKYTQTRPPQQSIMYVQQTQWAIFSVELARIIYYLSIISIQSDDIEFFFYKIFYSVVNV